MFQPAAPSKQDRLPFEIYASHVEALYSDASSLTVGIIAACLTTVSTGLLLGNVPIAGVGMALALLGLVRLRFMRRFWLERSGAGEKSLRRWEKGYVLGGSLHLALLGLFCILAFTQSNDAFAWIASLSITMAYLIGTPGRSFASRLLVDAQILVSALPIVVSLMVAGGRYWIVILFVILPFMVALKTISTRLQGIFEAAVLRARDLSILAGRFDTALRNMPHGLAMFDAGGHIAVENARFRTLLGSEGGAGHHQTVAEILLAFAREDNQADVRRRLSPDGGVRVTPDTSETWTIARHDGRSISFTLQGMREGGGVLIVQDVTDQVRAEASLAFLARFDQLTGLPNRYGFQDRVADQLRDAPERAGVLMFIDLDRFKEVNDALGHTMGDRLLQAVATRLRASTQPDALLARFGGDEFTLFQRLADAKQEGAELATQLISRLSEPFDISGQHIVIGATVGIAEVAGPASSIDSLLQDADLALYRAKATQKGTFRFFEPEMQTFAITRREIDADMRTAIERGDMTLFFQPMVDVIRGNFTTCEALLRWNHPTRGFISPMEFIGIAEETGYIWDLGQHVLRQACLECARWPGQVRVAVNVSALQFQRGDLPEIALAAVRDAGLAPERLEIEVTETALLRDLNEARATMHKLQGHGFRLSLDDFGTGYSALSYIQHLPFDKVKLDRSFLTGLADHNRGLKVLQGVARLCSDLGISVIMEGVETAEQLDIVVNHAGIYEIQGFLVSKPAPAIAVRKILESAPTMPWGTNVPASR